MYCIHPIEEGELLAILKQKDCERVKKRLLESYLLTYWTWSPFSRVLRVFALHVNFITYFVTWYGTYLYKLQEASGKRALPGICLCWCTAWEQASTQNDESSSVKRRSKKKSEQHDEIVSGTYSAFCSLPSKSQICGKPHVHFAIVLLSSFATRSNLVFSQGTISFSVNMTKRLCILTGGSKGLGRSISYEFARHFPSSGSLVMISGWTCLLTCFRFHFA